MKILALAGAAALALSLAACNLDETAGTVVEANPGETVVETAPAEPLKPSAKVGDKVDLGDWDVVVKTVQHNADAEIFKANQFNDKPKFHYTLVTYEATYTGPERISDASADLSWSFTTTDSKVASEASVVSPLESVDTATEARNGGTVTGQVAFDINADLAAGGLLTVEATDSSFEEFYADFVV